MAEYRPSPAQAAALDGLFAALSDRTRRAMLGALAGGERSVGELAAPFDMSLAAASKHIKVLEAAGLVKREVRGRTHRVRLDAHPLHAGAEWLRHYERFWTLRLDALEALLQAEDRAVGKAGKAAKPRSKR
jgi:DNA-binding transcriptional ArsR family regulator